MPRINRTRTPRPPRPSHSGRRSGTSGASRRKSRPAGASSGDVSGGGGSGSVIVHATEEVKDPVVPLTAEEIVARQTAEEVRREAEEKKVKEDREKQRLYAEQVAKERAEREAKRYEEQKEAELQRLKEREEENKRVVATYSRVRAVLVERHEKRMVYNNCCYCCVKPATVTCPLHNTWKEEYYKASMCADCFAAYGSRICYWDRKREGNHVNQGAFLHDHFTRQHQVPDADDDEKKRQEMVDEHNQMVDDRNQKLAEKARVEAEAYSVALNKRQTAFVAYATAETKWMVMSIPDRWRLCERVMKHVESKRDSDSSKLCPACFIRPGVLYSPTMRCRICNANMCADCSDALGFCARCVHAKDYALGPERVLLCEKLALLV